MPYEVRMNNGRHCVYKQGTDSSMGCHDTHEDALAQMRALYAQEGGKMSESISFLVSLADPKFEQNSDSQWIHALPLGQYQHPMLGKLDMSVDKITRLAESVKKRVRGIDPSINYNHNNEDKAAGWVKDAQVRSNGLWLLVEWVKAAAESIRNKEYRYFSAEFDDEWASPEGKTFKDVVRGGALTNRPFMKNLVPINLSESVIDNAFDLVSGITGIELDELKGNKTPMSPEELQAIIDGVVEKIKPTPTPNVNPTPVAKLEEIEDFRKLAEANPVAKSLLAHFEYQAQALMESGKRMRESMVDTKLSEFDNSKLTLTPATKELAREIALGVPDEVIPKFWQLLEQVRTSASFMVELGERSGAGVKPSYSMLEKSATQVFSERTNELMRNEKIDFLTAVERVAAEDPKLYDAYRLGDGAQVTR